MTIPPKVGIFIGGDNVSASHAERINQIAGTLGVISMKRSYFRQVPRNLWAEVPEGQEYGGQRGTGDPGSQYRRCLRRVHAHAEVRHGHGQPQDVRQGRRFSELATVLPPSAG